MDFFSIIKQRRSTRHFDPAAEISPAELEELIAAAGRSPSGNNSQPWRFVAVTDRHLREKLLPAAFNQQQILTASAILVILADREAYGADNLTRIHQQEYEDGCFSADTRDFLTRAAIDFYRAHDDATLQKMLGLDTGLCAMILMLAAEARGWNTVPMTGYVPAQLRQILDIPARYTDVMMIAIGKAAQPGHRTLRRPVSEILTWNKVAE
ncbi:nitroreductase family protein [Neisseria sp.]|uniref:nitroreductase family protein n=1 Tax=Neisseria sp. TaxID=192066 RepID=UPI0035A1584D